VAEVREVGFGARAGEEAGEGAVRGGDEGWVIGREAEEEVEEGEVGFYGFLGRVRESALRGGCVRGAVGVVGELHNDGVHEVVEDGGFVRILDLGGRAEALEGMCCILAHRVPVAPREGEGKPLVEGDALDGLAHGEEVVGFVGEQVEFGAEDRLPPSGHRDANAEFCRLIRLFQAEALQFSDADEIVGIQHRLDGRHGVSKGSDIRRVQRRKKIQDDLVGQLKQLGALGACRHNLSHPRPSVFLHRRLPCVVEPAKVAMVRPVVGMAPGPRGSLFGPPALQVDAAAPVLLNLVAGEEAQQLDQHAPQRIRRRPALVGVQDGGADVLAKHVRVLHMALDGDGGCLERVVVGKAHFEVQRILQRGCEDHACVADVAVVDEEMDVGVGILA